MKDINVEIEGYNTTVFATRVTIDVEVNGTVVLELYGNESKALRKALKRAERLRKEARR